MKLPRAVVFTKSAPKTLLEVFTKEDASQKQRKKKNRAARATGGKAEALLSAQLTALGYEVRRTHLSAFPDIIAWTSDELLLIEVKARAEGPKALSGCLSLFRSGVRTMTSVPDGAKLLCYVRVSERWAAYEWCDNVTVQVEALVSEERSCEGQGYA